MNLGGVEKSFLNLITDTSFKDCEIHVGLLRKKGDYMAELPSNVIIHECCKGLWNDINKPIHQLIIENLKAHNLKKTFLYSLDYLKYKINGNREHFYKNILKGEPEINIEFDEAYAYAGPASIIDYYVVNKIKALKKVGWIHFDISKVWVDSHLIRSLYPIYEKIFVVSKEAKIKFDNQFSEFSDKTEVRYNIVNKEKIRDLALQEETFDDDFHGKRILTVGRISKEKGQDIAIEALKILIEKGYNIRWYFIGDGPFLAECINKVKSLGLDNYAIFMGKKENPYPYMKDCDIYVQPSRHEGYCLTLAETRCFDNPIVATSFTGASEQLKETTLSFIADITPESISDGIEYFLNIGIVTRMG